MARAARTFVLVALALGACAGDRDQRAPGEKLGTFVVQGKLLGTTCGKADPTLRYEVGLSREGDTLYWLQGPSPIPGTIDASRRVRIEATASAKVVAEDRASGSPGCTLERRDTLSAALDGEPIRGFSGAIVYRFGVVEGDCMSELSSQGGDYATLPCTMTYEVVATPKGEGGGLEGSIGTRARDD